MALSQSTQRAVAMRSHLHRAVCENALGKKRRNGIGSNLVSASDVVCCFKEGFALSLPCLWDVLPFGGGNKGVTMKLDTC